jgi:hypothetical protein
MCNIRSAGTHHCPWCAHNPAFGYLAMLVPQGLISFWPIQGVWWKRFAMALAAFPLFGGMAALIYGIASGYW